MKNKSVFPGILWKIVLGFVFLLSFCELLFQVPQLRTLFTSPHTEDRAEKFSSSLGKISSLDQLEEYTDEIYSAAVGNNHDPSAYPAVLKEVVEERFRHGYVTYEIGNNFLAMLAGEVTGRSYDAIVKSDDILKFSVADCRQQSLVMMDVLRRKGYPVRAVFMKALNHHNEHFAFETYFDNGWHFFDPDFETNTEELRSNNWPSVAMLAVNKELRERVYADNDQALIGDLFSYYRYGPANQLVPERMQYFHSVTGIVSFYAWLGVLVMFLFSRLRLKISKIRKWRSTPAFSHSIGRPATL